MAVQGDNSVTFTSDILTHRPHNWVTGSSSQERHSIFQLDPETQKYTGQKSINPWAWQGMDGAYPTMVVCVYMEENVATPANSQLGRRKTEKKWEESAAETLETEKFKHNT